MGKLLLVIQDLVVLTSRSIDATSLQAVERMTKAGSLQDHGDALTSGRSVDVIAFASQSVQSSNIQPQPQGDNLQDHNKGQVIVFKSYSCHTHRTSVRPTSGKPISINTDQGGSTVTLGVSTAAEYQTNAKGLDCVINWYA